ncbi:hypothetical protein [Lentilactobacillus kisonensis]|uniref:hypothetical protein n=1 Tax=Lentilactobacillus kisonensis TaxID=481722 RepID=UPI001FB49ED2|nr:hypothetical protein [Lentilactobacillus kisonensis]
MAILAVAAKRPASKAFLVVILALELMVNFSIATSGPRLATSKALNEPMQNPNG